MYFQRQKRMRKCNDENFFDKTGSLPCILGNSLQKTNKVTNSDDPFTLPDILEYLAEGKYGSITKEYEKLQAENMRLMNYLFMVRSSLASSQTTVDINASIGPDACDALQSNCQFSSHFKARVAEANLAANDNATIAITYAEDEIDYVDFYQRTKGMSASEQIIVIDSDEEPQHCQITGHDNVRTEQVDCYSVDAGYEQCAQYHQIILRKADKTESILTIQCKPSYRENDGGSNVGSLDVKATEDDQSNTETLLNPEIKYLSGAPSSPEDESHSYALLEFHNEDACDAQESDSLGDLWKEMSLALEYSKATVSDNTAAVVMAQGRPEDCEHDYLLKDDIGVVCQLCGVIKKSISTIFDYQWRKGSQTTKTYANGSQKSKDVDEDMRFPGPKYSEYDFFSAKLSIHPRHLKQMKPHQLQGFNFLMRNLVGDKPGGCILAHAPGSGKTFMLISFIQSFLACFPSARPLIILPKGILPTWKREFQRWQVEDVLLFDFYSVKAESRSQQLEVLRSWEENQSVLFLGYKQFSTIICDVKDQTGAACQERLLKVPSLLILDEGHTPRNEDTDILSTLAKVRTPLKVVLSGTLFQNRVKEVFNILNLVRCKFLKTEPARAAVKRILSRARAPRRRRRGRKGDAEAAFFEFVEETLQSDDDDDGGGGGSAGRVGVIRDLREMTRDVLHYYKGDFLEELPGHADFTVMLRLRAAQKELLEELGSYDKFKRAAVESAVYLHPCLKDLAARACGSRSVQVTEKELDHLLNSVDAKDGVKTRFLLDILSMADAAGEKVLVFSQYILPLRFLERLLARSKGWRPGREMFAISGDTSAERREWAMERFNQSPGAKILLGSIKACGEGISLVGASRVIILDVHLNPSVSQQAVARAFRPGQTRRVFTYRLVAADSPEEEHHCACFRKELIAKMWFEWDERRGRRQFELESARVQDCQDPFLAHLPCAEQDIVALYTR